MAVGRVCLQNISLSTSGQTEPADAHTLRGLPIGVPKSVDAICMMTALERLPSSELGRRKGKPAARILRAVGKLDYEPRTR